MKLLIRQGLQQEGVLEVRGLKIKRRIRSCLDILYMVYYIER